MYESFISESPYITYKYSYLDVRSILDIFRGLILIFWWYDLDNMVLSKDHGPMTQAEYMANGSATGPSFRIQQTLYILLALIHFLIRKT